MMKRTNSWMNALVLASALTVGAAYAEPVEKSSGEASQVTAKPAKTSASKPGNAGQTEGLRVNINTSNAAELARALDGVGLKKAEAIIVYRNAHGAFKTVEELLKVRGIGPATLTANASRLAVK